MMLRRFAEVDTEIPPTGAQRILDIGSAWGYNVMALSRVGIDAVGMDLVIDQFAVGARIAGENGLHLSVVGADAAHLPFGDGEFTSITMVETFEHIYEQDRARAIAECRRVLGAGGRLILSTPNHGSIIERVKRIVVKLPWLQRRLPTMCYPVGDIARSEYHPYRYHRPWSVGEITDQIESLGFKVLKVKHFLFVFKNAPDTVVPALTLLERILEKTPGLRRLAATVCVVAQRV
ncbi:MAG: class I SAM-dependent methyltransferase [Candidatus Latescibacterota bacterium]|nr:MAG: class I SAM-dependent methyltransferase [Candidatus Latescibacterota bacterium]